MILAVVLVEALVDAYVRPHVETDVNSADSVKFAAFLIA